MGMNLKERQRAFDTGEVWKLDREFNPIQIKDASGGPEIFSQCEIPILVVNIINHENVEESMNRLVLITRSDWFDRQRVCFEPVFINWICSAINAFREGEDVKIETALKLVINIWYVNRFDPIIISDGLVRAVSSLIFAGDDSVLRHAFAAMANLAGYISEAFECCMEESFCRRIEELAREGRSAEPLLRFMLGMTRGGMKDMIDCCAFIGFLASPIPEVKGLSAELVREFVRETSSCDRLISCGIVQKLMDALKYSDAARTMPIFGSFVAIMDRDIVDPFVTVTFAGCITDAINQHLTIPAGDVYKLIHRIVKLGHGLKLYEAGVMEAVLSSAARAIFENRRMAALCIAEFLKCTEEPYRSEVGIDKDGFKFLCDVIWSLDESDACSVMEYISVAAEKEQQYRAIAIVSGLGETDPVEGTSPRMQHAKNMLLQALSYPCDEGSLVKVSIAREPDVFDDGDVSDSEES